MRQALDGMNILSKQHVIHCDLKPENILLVKEHSPELMNTVGSTSSSVGTSDTGLSIKLIDFGSACFEGQFSHTYIQSRFYRSPEVLLGIDYGSAIDVWSLGCVAAELLLGLPLLPGLNEHDQLTRICEMIGNIPDWMIENGYALLIASLLDHYDTVHRLLLLYFVGFYRTKGLKHFVREPKNSFPSQTSDLGPLHRREDGNFSSWRLMSSNDYYTSLSEEEKEKISIGKSTHRYFKRKLLGDIISLHARVNTAEDKDNLPLFIHLLTGVFFD
jgi:dual specificity protein kinase YAK1